MEDLLTKNIFSNKSLNKLSPDYYPPDITFRMQERRSMFKDIYSHNILTNNNWNRKPLKSVKEEFKIHKEIAKLRNDFRNMNLRNQILVKRHIIKNTTPKSEIGYDCDLLLNDLKVLHDDTHKHINDIEEDMNKLVLLNDSEFKLNNKPKVEKHITDNRRNKTKATIPNDDTLSPISIYDDNLNEHTIRIECRCDTGDQELSARLDIENDVSEPILPPISDAVDLKINTHSTFDSQSNDLQTLLIMMALSKPNICDEPEANSPYFNNDLQSTQVGHDTKFEFDEALFSSKKGDVTEILSITPLKIELDNKTMNLAKRFVKKWKEYVIKRKEILGKQRENTVSNFLDKLSKKKLDVKQSNDYVNKAKALARDYDTYQHRYKVQKHIIALQKAKLEEQNRLIENLKYNRIIEASRQSIDVMKEEVRKTYYDIDRQLKPKIKCLTNELKLHEIEEPSLVLHCLKVPRFIQRMEKRAREREEKHAMIRERRRQMEEERIRLKQQAEIAKAEMDKEEKIKRIEELREKRRKDKIETIRRKQYAARLRSLIVMADLHYEKSLTSKYGIRPFRILLQIKRDNIEKAKLHYAFQLKKNAFFNWMWYTEDMLFERNYIAEEYYRKNILKKVFGALKSNVREYTLKKQVALDYYDLFVTQLVFRKFREAVDNVKKENEIKWQKSVIYHNSNMLFKVLTCWRTLPALNALKREQEARKARWREKVLIVVPDYVPPDD